MPEFVNIFSQMLGATNLGPLFVFMGSLIILRLLLTPFMGKDGPYIALAFLVVGFLPSIGYAWLGDIVFQHKWPTQWPMSAFTLAPLAWLGMVWVLAWHTRIENDKDEARLTSKQEEQ